MISSFKELNGYTEVSLCVYKVNLRSQFTLCQNVRTSQAKGPGDTGLRLKKCQWVCCPLIQNHLYLASPPNALRYGIKWNLQL